MTLPIRWTTRAKRRLEAVFRYIAAENPAAALALQDRIESLVVSLAEHPYLYRPGRAPGTRELVAHPNYIVIYSVRDAEVVILNVVHARQQYP